MVMATILFMCPGPFISTFVPLTQGDLTNNLAVIAVSEEKLFLNG